MPNIRIDDAVYKYLKDHAEPFVDSPNSVLRRLLPIEVKSESSGTAGLAAQLPRQRVKVKSKGKRKGRSRAEKGSLLPEEVYVGPILQALQECGGVAATAEVISRVGTILEDRFTIIDRDVLSSGQVRWKNRVQFVRLRLVDEGLLSRDSGRGMWALTRDGEQRASNYAPRLAPVNGASR